MLSAIFDNNTQSLGSLPPVQPRPGPVSKQPLYTPQHLMAWNRRHQRGGARHEHNIIAARRRGLLGLLVAPAARSQCRQCAEQCRPDLLRCQLYCSLSCAIYENQSMSFTMTCKPLALSLASVATH